MTRALVTGASGFIGSFVVDHLVRRQVDVAILRRPATDLWRLGPMAAAVRHLVGDLEEPDTYREAVEGFGPDTVLHLAWHGVGNTHRNDPAQAQRNLHATLSLLEVAAEAGARTWIGAGSQAEYGPHPHPLGEEAPTRPTTLYGAAKLAASHLTRCLAAQRRLRFAWLRVFSTYGPKDHPGWLIPSLVRALAKGERPALTPGEQRWDYLHVEDAARAFGAVAATPSAEGVFNLGSGEARPLREIVERVRDAVNPDLPLGFGEIPYRPDQVMLLQADTRRLREATGWTPERTLETALPETVRWYLAHPDPE